MVPSDVESLTPRPFVLAQARHVAPAPRTSAGPGPSSSRPYLGARWARETSTVSAVSISSSPAVRVCRIALLSRETTWIIIRVQEVSSAGGWRHGTSVAGRCDYCVADRERCKVGQALLEGLFQSRLFCTSRCPTSVPNSHVSRSTLPHRSCWSDGREVSMLCSLQPKGRLQSSMQWRSSRPNDAQIRKASRLPCQCQA